MPPVGRPPESAAQPAGPLVELGRIVTRHGIRGEVRVLLHNPTSTIAASVSRVALTGADGAPEWRRVLGARRHKQFLLLHLEGVATANEAEALVGRGVAMAREQLPPPEPNAVYHVDLIGCAVQTVDGVPLGTVSSMIVTGSNDVCVVTGTGREYLVPLVADVVAHLDLTARLLIVHPLPGLLDA